jgi:peptidoglycan pentaglycine glycine transferase (the first glycine)
MTSSKILVRELVNDDRRALDKFVGQNVYGDLMQSWEWGSVKSSGGDWRPLRIGAFDSSNRFIGSISILVRKLPLVGNFYYAARGPVLADWSDAGLLTALLESIRDYARKDSAAFLKIDPALPVENAEAQSLIERSGFQPPTEFDVQGFGGTQPRTVMVLDIGGPSMDDLLMACKPQCRRNIRISEKKGVEIIPDTTRDDLALFYELLKITAERDGFRVRGFAYYETLWDELVPRGLGKVFLTKYEGNYLSGAFCFVIGDKCVYVYGASSNENRNVMPNYGMQWAMIAWAKSQGCTLYDFRGVSPKKQAAASATEQPQPDDHLQGLNRFKEGFGARYVEYIGEYDLIYNKAAYWLWTHGKPKAQELIKKFKKT